MLRQLLQAHLEARGFAAKHVGRPFARVMIGASMEAAAAKLMESLGIGPGRPAGLAET